MTDLEQGQDVGVVRPSTLADLLSLDDDSLAKCSLARMNMLCAIGLPGASELDMDGVESTLVSWLPEIRRQTEHYLHAGFHHTHSDYYHGSENFLRMAMIISVTKKAFGVEYNQARIAEQDIGQEANATSKPDYRDCRDLFIHGMVEYSGNAPANGGTCCSMPLLIVSLARMLGYPAYLSTAREHVFCRWDGKGDRFNVERHNSGVAFMHDDGHYRIWPKPMNDEFITSRGALRNLTRQQELALCLSFRAYVLEANGCFSDAARVLEVAERLHPKCVHYTALKYHCWTRDRLIEPAIEKFDSFIVPSFETLALPPQGGLS